MLVPVLWFIFLPVNIHQSTTVVSNFTPTSCNGPKALISGPQSEEQMDL